MTSIKNISDISMADIYYGNQNIMRQGPVHAPPSGGVMPATWFQQPYNFSGAGDILEEFWGSMHRMDRFSSVLLISLYVPAFIMALIGNVLVIFVVTTKRTLRNVRNYFLVNLAFADLTITLICMPIMVGTIIYKLWVFGDFLCRLVSFLQGVAVSASILTLTVMGVDRFISIEFMLSQRRVTKRRHAVCIMCIVWAVSLVIMSPIVVVRTLDYTHIPPLKPMTFCIEDWPTKEGKHAFGIFLLFVVYVIPALTLLVCYSRIGTQLCREDLERHESNSSANNLSSRKRAARILILLVFLFMAFWLPYNIVSLIIDFTEDTDPMGILPYTLWLGHAHSAVNPVMYWCFNHRFRAGVTGIRKIVCSCSGSKSTYIPPPPPSPRPRIIRAACGRPGNGPVRLERHPVRRHMARI